MELSNKTIMTVKRRRKQRSQKLKELLKEEEEGNVSQDSWSARFTGEEVICPLCSATVRGDQDVLDAHVDSCLAHESQRLEEARQRELMHQHAIEEEIRDMAGDHGNYVGDVRGSFTIHLLRERTKLITQPGADFYRRNDEECVDEDVDIDGDDQTVFGEAQFTEGDIVPVNERTEEIDEDVEIEIENDDDDEAQQAQKSLRDLIAAGKRKASQVTQTSNVNHSSEADKIELAILNARQRGDKASLVSSLENKIRLLVCKTLWYRTYAS